MINIHQCADLSSWRLHYSLHYKFIIIMEWDRYVLMCIDFGINIYSWGNLVGENVGKCFVVWKESWLGLFWKLRLSFPPTLSLSHLWFLYSCPKILVPKLLFLPFFSFFFFKIFYFIFRRPKRVKGVKFYFWHRDI